MDKENEPTVWECGFCGEYDNGIWVPTENDGTTSICKVCGGPRKTA